ncbi:protein FAR1-RELATED SEQUENCE 1-like [Prunus dulcis]|uniref:protein FAR1-RELATED SEQUENCE 1-like n=1 Tax=Prunus dulcis TaxID=3755 RepID=UPI0014831C86|nr:protein FAR1-RELATED SEQUENCE 1-like [Prunus dulcis]
MVVKAGNTYTKAIFEDFQAQYIKSLELDMISCDKDGVDLVYTVVLRGNSKERRVRKQKDGDVSCSCRLFEMKGFLCSHALKILTNYMNVKEIPDQYILKRCTRKARSKSVKDMHGRDIQTYVKPQQTSRYRSLCSMFTMISSRAESEETYKISVSHLNQLSKTIEDMLSSKMDGQVHDKNGQGSPSTIVTDGANETMNLMIDKPHTASNVDQTGDGIWNHGSIYQ